MQWMISIFFPASYGTLYSSRASQTRIMNLEKTTLHTTKAGAVPPVSSTLTAGFYFATDLGPSRYDHPIVYNTAENRKLLADILSFVEKLTFKLGREKEHAFKIPCIRYTRGNGMGKNADYFGIKLAKIGGYRVRLCISIREPQEITFLATLVKKGQEDREGSVCPGLGFQMTTRGGADAYIMTSHGNGGCFLFFTDNKMNVAV